MLSGNKSAQLTAHTFARNISHIAPSYVHFSYGARCVKDHCEMRRSRINTAQYHLIKFSPKKITNIIFTMQRRRRFFYVRVRQKVYMVTVRVRA